MLQDVAIANVLVSVILAVWAIADVQRRPPKMAVMKWVWPLTFLWGGVLALTMYLWFGRAPVAAQSQGHGGMHGEHHGHGRRSLWQSVALGATHCGAGCTMADVLTESGLFLLAIQFVFLGHRVFGNWLIDYFVALIFGVIFQYAAQAPMSDAPRVTVWWQSFKSDVLSLTSWQVGMYGWMAISMFLLFPRNEMHPDQWLFWWMMQVAMLCGFLTAYPVNWLLIRLKIKEAM